MDEAFCRAGATPGCSQSRLPPREDSRFDASHLMGSRAASRRGPPGCLVRCDCHSVCFAGLSGHPRDHPGRCERVL